MSKIRILSDDLIGKIAAGEVVERPASVVKELVENSIDAGAGSIHIDITDSGLGLIRISDNGEGMDEEDVKLSAVRHATSKIKDQKGLETVNTLGFRGEALASIAAVSRMEITTYNGEGKTGVYLYMESGQTQKLQPASRVRGTTIEARNLFYNIPARKKFLKRDSAELSAIIEVVGRYILSNPDIEFSLEHSGHNIFMAPKNMNLIDRIRMVMGDDLADNLVEISGPPGKYGIHGYISRPSKTRKDKKGQVFFVNNRFVKSIFLSNAVQITYDSMLERGRYPSCVLFISVPPGEIDVNVHPTKLMIKFDNEKDVRHYVSGVINDKFDLIKEKHRLTYKITDPSLRNETHLEETQSEFIYNIPGRMPLVENHGYSTEIGETNVDESAGPDILAGDKGYALYQVAKCFIVEAKKNSITITDQHTAHERVLYEYFTLKSKNKDKDIQNLLFPVRVDLSRDEAVLMEKLLDKFKELGFDISLFGESSYIVHAVPSILKEGDIKNVIMDVLSDLGTFDVKKINPEDELIKMMSCRAAVKSGDELNSGEMGFLLMSLDNCTLPFTCPHGRPTSIDITVDELEKRFHRK